MDQNVAYDLRLIVEHEIKTQRGDVGRCRKKKYGTEKQWFVQAAALGIELGSLTWVGVRGSHGNRGECTKTASALNMHASTAVAFRRDGDAARAP